MRIQVNYECSENWEQMKLQGEGRFCESCEKEVIDFSQWTDAEIAKKLLGGKNLCGRMPKERINRPLNYKAPKRNPVMGLSLLTALAASTSLMGQEDSLTSKPKLELKAQGYTALKYAEFADDLPASKLSYRGKVLDMESQTGLPFVNIIVRQDSNFITGASSDLDGFFELQIEDYNPNTALDIEFTFLGYKDTSLSILPQQLHQKSEKLIGLQQEENPPEITIEMNPEYFVMGMMVTVESVEFNRNGEPRNWFGRKAYRLKQFYRRLRYH